MAKTSRPKNKCRVLLEWGGRLYRFLSVKFDDGPSGDGSLYITLDRKSRRRWNPATDNPPTCEDPNDPELPKLKFSYHATGRIHVVGLSGDRDGRRYGEPTLSVSRTQPLFLVSMPGPEVLVPFTNTVSATDFVVRPFEAAQGRRSIEVGILPDRDDVAPIGSLVVRYEGWFRVAVVACPYQPQLQPGAERAVLTMIPDQSLYPSQVLNRQQAVKFFHRKITGSRGHVIYWNENKQEFRVIFPEPMRKAPLLKIVLVDKNLRVEEVETTESGGRFVVKHPSGRLAGPPPRLAMLSADADL
jgi:hypothetical protein